MKRKQREEEEQNKDCTNEKKTDLRQQVNLVEQRLKTMEQTLEMVELQMNREVQLLYLIRNELELHLSKKYYEEEIICSDSFVQPEYPTQPQTNEKRTVFSPVMFPMAPSFPPVVFPSHEEKEKTGKQLNNANEHCIEEISLPPIT
ncbi:hypothetical protein EDI_218000 [Entamoeba dispar SAW760]|uniref:Uncharacterized protein n=1 Tax=Entamoeba dispar (strain ATCC PRA-260 / SAW760) TaxID=370354 RepID=B0ENL4_ENTDS|nr:uncharacterized protein EDI_218000 [Entamoeba dispar SAW760]EDR23895.1 hypothetical protein EDI_218000 [Entamoeba dispar SAW760]|eukprot:EDR23895.1 hypothetical protein EDI_218000 [Entamoeba dispar SAW760]